MGVDEGDLQVVLSIDKMYNVDAILENSPMTI